LRVWIALFTALVAAGCAAPAAEPPPEFHVVSFVLNPPEVREGEVLTVVIEVRNVGGRGEDAIGARVGNDWIDFKQVELAANETRYFTFEAKVNARRDVDVVGKSGDDEMSAKLGVLDSLIGRPIVRSRDTGWCRDGASVEVVLTNTGNVTARDIRITILVKDRMGKLVGNEAAKVEEIAPGSTVTSSTQVNVADKDCGGSDYYDALATVTTGLGHVYETVVTIDA
jgi:hypothetical protein